MKLDLDAIEARAEKATSGPWINTFDNPPHPEFGYGISQSATSYPHAVICLPHPNTGRGTFKPSRETANFIAHARTDIPALLAFAKEARAALEYYGGFWGVHQGSPINAVNKFTQNRLNETGDKAREVLQRWFGEEK